MPLVSLRRQDVPPPTPEPSAWSADADVTAKRADLRAVVLVRDRSRSVVELELLERRERPVARPRAARAGAARPRRARRARRTRAPAPGGTAARRRRRRRRRAPPRARARASTASPGCRPRDARATSLRCSRRSGHSVMSEPRRKTSPASQMRLTSGLTKTRKYTLPSGSICSAMTKRSSPVSLSLRIPTSFETCCSIVYAFFPASSVPRSRSAARDVERRADLGRVRRSARSSSDR